MFASIEDLCVSIITITEQFGKRARRGYITKADDVVIHSRQEGDLWLKLFIEVYVDKDKPVLIFTRTGVVRGGWAMRANWDSPQVNHFVEGKWIETIHLYLLKAEALLDLKEKQSRLRWGR
jgi:hypothetical protein